MDTLSSSVSTIKVPSFHSIPREFLHHFKTPNTSNTLPPQPQFLSSTTKPNSSITTKTLTFTPKTSISPLLPSSQSLKSSLLIHRKAASGYAAALLDISQCNNSLKEVEKDVRRLSKLLQNKQIRAMREIQKGQVVKEIAEDGKFERHLVGLLKMLIEKNKVGIISEVVEEFERIYDELSGTRVVLVESKEKIEEDQLFGIAKRVQKLSGAMKVKVKNLIDGSLPSSFAV